MTRFLKGFLTINVDKKEYTLNGSDFSHQEGGDYSSSFLFIHFKDEDMGFPEVRFSFKTDGGELINREILFPGEDDVEIIEDELSIPDEYFNYDPDEH